MLQSVEEIKSIAFLEEKEFLSSELYRFNNFYSHASSIKKYCGLKDHFSIKAAIEHGLSFTKGVMPSDYEVELPAIFASGKRRFSAIKSKTDKFIFNIGPQINYSEQYYSDYKLEIEKKRIGKTLVVFPAHSTHLVNYEYDEIKFDAEIKKISKKYDSVIICLYYVDIQKGLLAKYDSLGYECYSCGHRLDPNFGPRLVSLFTLADMTMSNCIGSHIGQSLLFNKPHYFFKDWIKAYANKDDYNQHGFLASYAKQTEYYKKTKNLIEEAFSVLEFDITDHQRKIGQIHFGTDEKKLSRVSLKQTLEICEDMYNLKNEDFNDYKTFYKLIDNYEKEGDSPKAELLLKKIKEYELNIEDVKKRTFTNNIFTNSPLCPDNMDLFWVRSSIKKAIEKSLKTFQGIVLDLGCGEMPYKEFIINNQSAIKKYIGLDIKNPLYQSATQPDLFWDGDKIPLEDNSIDVVMATEMLEHIPEPDNLLEEVNRVLKIGGLFFFTTPFIWSLHSVPNDEYRYTPFSLKRLLKKTGFDKIEIKALGGWNASLATMIGLWCRRKPMSNDERKFYSDKFFNIYKDLVNTDEIPDSFSEGQIVTGFSGTAVKYADVKKNVANLNQKTVLAIVTPNIGTLSETFIKKHINTINPEYTVVISSNIWGNWGDYPILQLGLGEGFVTCSSNEESMVVNFFKEHNVTHILCEYGCYSSKIIELNYSKLKLPIFIHFHGGDISGVIRKPGMYQYYKSLGEKVTGFIANSKAMKNRLRNLGFNENKIFVSHYGVDIPEYSSKGITNNTCKFIFVGRFVDKKAPLNLVKSFKLVYSKNPNVELHLIGDYHIKNKVTSLFDKVKSYIEENLLNKVVILHGAQDQNYVANELLNSSVYVQHSVTDPISGDAEGLPNSILEASAFGLPIISTYHEGIPEEVEDGKTGFLVEENDIEGFADKMEFLAANPDIRNKMGRNARIKMITEFSSEIKTLNLKKILFEKQEYKHQIEDLIKIVESKIYNNKFDEAKVLIERVIENSNNSELYNLLGIVHFSQKDHLKAIDSIETAINLNPRNKNYYLNLIDIINIVGNNEKLRQIFIRYQLNFPMDDNELQLPVLNLNWADLKLLSNIKLYAGDIVRTYDNYSGFAGLSLINNDGQHIKHDITDSILLPDNSVDIFQAEDVFEHIEYEKLPKVINEIFRVLKPGGCFRLSVPDYRCDILFNRSEKDANGKIIFDPGGGGTRENPAHLWYPNYENVKNLLTQTKFAASGRINYLHYYITSEKFITKSINYSLSYVHRTPDYDERVQEPYRPFSIVVDLYKGNYYNKEFETHYDSKYFDFQKSIGEFGGKANLFKFDQFIKPSHTILDFGCGGGFLLNNINAVKKYGVEINEVARNKAQSFDIKAYTSINELPDNYFDIIISNHALEHVDEPLSVLKKLSYKLKSGGKIVFVVPHEKSGVGFNPDDINQHLYTWNEQTFANLFKKAGYRIVVSERIQHAWPPNYDEIVEKFGWEEFHRICFEFAMKNDISQIRVVAEWID